MGGSTYEREKTSGAGAGGELNSAALGRSVAAGLRRASKTIRGSATPRSSGEQGEKSSLDRVTGQGAALRYIRG